MSGLTPKQKKFADKYVDTGNGTKAALEAYNAKNDNTASSIASENLRKPEIVAYLEDHVAMAKGVIAELAVSADSEQVRLQAAKDIVDRVDGRPIQRNINANTEQEGKEYRWAE